MAALILSVFGAWQWVDSKLNRSDWLADTPNTPASTWLILGSDERDGSTDYGGVDNISGFRTDTILVLIKPKSGPSSLVSIPRDSLMNVDNQYMKINAVALIAGKKALVSNVEQITGQKIDHVAQIKFGGLQNVADAINIEVFGRTDVTRAGAAAGSPSSAFLMNETRGSVQNGAYLNPSLRYQGTEDNRSQIRSQMLGFECIGMEVGDINRDGKNEILLLNDNTLNAYVWQNGNKLVEIGEYRLPSSMKPVLVRIYTQDKKTYVLLSGYDKGDTAAYSQVLQFSNGKFNVVVRNARRYLNVAKLPPLYAPVLIMQDSDRSKVVSGSVYEGRISGDEVVRGGKVANLPKQATVFNFSWIPADRGKRGDHLALIAENETLLTFDARGNRLSGTEETYSGSSVYVEGDRGIGALASSGESSDVVLYYVPMRMPVVDLDRDGRYELIVNKPVTTAGKLFSNYRTYPQGEVHAMLWNGMGMDLLWKTRRIKGTVCDVAVVDANNNGKLDLVVAVNSYAGLSTGIKTRCAVYLYPLDTTMVNAKPNYQE